MTRQELIEEFDKLGFVCDWYGFGCEYDWEHMRDVPYASYVKYNDDGTEKERLLFSILNHIQSKEYRYKYYSYLLPNRKKIFDYLANNDYIYLKTKGRKYQKIEPTDMLYPLYKKQMKNLLLMQWERYGEAADRAFTALLNMED